MKTTFVIALSLFVLLALSACVPGPNQAKGTPTEHATVAGFWLGLWQGFIAPIIFLLSLFKSDVNIYEVHNNGALYNLGYLFGLACFFGGGGHQSRRCRK